MILEVIEPDKYERYLFRLASEGDFHFLWKIHNKALHHSEPKEALDWILQALFGTIPRHDESADEWFIRDKYDKTKLTLLEYSTVRDRVEVKKADWSRLPDEEWIVFWSN